MAAALPLVLAHAGHWLASLIYVVPVLVILGALGVQSLRDRRAGDRGARPRDHED